jgi:hypothetical protein
MGWTRWQANTFRRHHVPADEKSELKPKTHLPANLTSSLPPNVLGRQLPDTFLPHPASKWGLTMFML